MTDVEEHDIWLNPHGMDHLRDGAPVFKGIGEDVLLVLRSADWDTIKRVSESGGKDDESKIGGCQRKAEWHIEWHEDGDWFDKELCGPCETAFDHGTKTVHNEVIRSRI